MKYKYIFALSILSAYAMKNHSLNQQLMNALTQPNYKTVEELLKEGACPDAYDPATGEYALHTALQAKDCPIVKVKMLLQYGADVHVVNKNNQTPAMLALNHRNYSRLTSLLLACNAPSQEHVNFNYPYYLHKNDISMLNERRERLQSQSLH